MNATFEKVMASARTKTGTVSLATLIVAATTWIQIELNDIHKDITNVRERLARIEGRNSQAFRGNESSRMLYSFPQRVTAHDSKADSTL